MTGDALVAEVRAFFETYLETFDSMDSPRIAALYHAPTVTTRDDGSIHCLRTREEFVRFFQGVADTYGKEVYRSGAFSNFSVVPIGGRSALATMDWRLCRADGSVIRGWRILASTFHVM
jgi:hypothetical protein